ncbi:hypothetical protein G7Y89_g13801 [Cudoniella acicularis]|uniref:Tyrosinase copper-binding domain-containing protein n=1 Tax=Cudoniella acicularis TaxID=354080 RepID=A0A8H4VW33_9HELO|nr:hypothetical protein G7Y89_g13801 [Cudoniella acicularis]
MKLISGIFLFLLPLVSAMPVLDAELATPAKNETAAERSLKTMAAKALNNTLATLDADVEAAKKAGLKPNCTRETLEWRQEFGSMAKDDRKAYTAAVACLMAKPNRTPKNISTGARSRFDDFIVTHVLQTPFVHDSATFLPWHRWYLYIYEVSLRKECGTGNGPNMSTPRRPPPSSTAMPTP